MARLLKDWLFCNKPMDSHNLMCMYQMIFTSSRSSCVIQRQQPLNGPVFHRSFHKRQNFSHISQICGSGKLVCFMTKAKESFLQSKYVQPSLNVRNMGQLHQGSDLSWKNPVFSGFMKALVDEYNSLTGEMSATPLDDAKTLRLQFLRPVADVVNKLQSKENEILEVSKLIEVEEDQEMKSLMEMERDQFQEEITEIEEELVDALVGEDLADSNDIVLEVSAGVGGQEAMLFSAEIFEMYCNYAHYKGWSFGGISGDESEMGGTRKASMEISGEDVYKHLKHEAGVHRVQRVPKTERSGRMHTSTITVSVIPKPKEIDIVIDPNDLKIETMRGSGPGGQSVNTTDSAVRVTHLPTGTVAECRQERSQIKNRSIAMEKLRMRMYQVKLEEQEAKRRTTRKMQMGNRGRSEKIRTYNFQQDRVSDHRVKGNVNNILEFMQGGEGLDDLIDSLEVEEKYSSVLSMLEEHELSMKKTKKS